jgi:hypothetical protein
VNEDSKTDDPAQESERIRIHVRRMLDKLRLWKQPSGDRDERSVDGQRNAQKNKT